MSSSCPSAYDPDLLDCHYVTVERGPGDDATIKRVQQQQDEAYCYDPNYMDWNYVSCEPFSPSPIPFPSRMQPPPMPAQTLPADFLVYLPHDMPNDEQIHIVDVNTHTQIPHISLQLICHFLELQDLISMSSTCKTWSRILQHKLCIHTNIKSNIVNINMHDNMEHMYGMNKNQNKSMLLSVEDVDNFPTVLPSSSACFSTHLLRFSFVSLQRVSTAQHNMLCRGLNSATHVELRPEHSCVDVSERVLSALSPSHLQSVVLILDGESSTRKQWWLQRVAQFTNITQLTIVDRSTQAADTMENTLDLEPFTQCALQSINLTFAPNKVNVRRLLSTLRNMKTLKHIAWKTGLQLHERIMINYHEYISVLSTNHQLHELHSLDLDVPLMSDELLSVLCTSFRTLTHMALPSGSNCSLTPLLMLDNIQCLDVGQDYAWDDASIVVLSQLQQLREFSARFRHTSLSAKCIEHFIAALRHVHSLTLHGFTFTAFAWSQLQLFPSLHSLSLHYCSGVSSDDFEQLFMSSSSSPSLSRAMSSALDTPATPPIFALDDDSVSFSSSSPSCYDSPRSSRSACGSVDMTSLMCDDNINCNMADCDMMHMHMECNITHLEVVSNNSYIISDKLKQFLQHHRVNLRFNEDLEQ